MVPHYPIEIEILIQQHVTIVRTIRQIVDDTEPRHVRPQNRFPKNIQGIVIDDQPRRVRVSHGVNRLPRVSFPGRLQPNRMRQSRVAFACRSPRQERQPVATGMHFVRQSIWQVPAYEVRVRAVRAQRVRQCQASHQMARTDRNGGISAKVIHGSCHERSDLECDFLAVPQQNSTTSHVDQTC